MPGERFPADGQVERNAALVDEQVLTGESRPVFKEQGARILGGTLNLDGDLVVRVNAVGPDGTLARLVELVKQARLSKGRYQRLVDRISTWFFPIVAGIAVLAFLLHWAFGSLGQGLMAGLAVSLIACPCALGLATPLAVWSAIGQAANHQVLFRSGEALERLADIGAVRFDKTGTLTTGAAVVGACQFEHPDERDNALARAAALAGCSSHVFSKAICDLHLHTSVLGSAPDKRTAFASCPGTVWSASWRVTARIHRYRLAVPCSWMSGGCTLALCSTGCSSRHATRGFRCPWWDGTEKCAGSSSSPNSGDQASTR